MKLFMQSVTSNADICQMLQGREVLHRFTALLFAEPTCDNWQRLHLVVRDRLLPAAADWLRGQSEIDEVPLSRGELPAEFLQPSLPLGRLPNSFEQFVDAYYRLFGLVAAGGCPLYATEYIPAKHAVQRSQKLADIAGYYRAFGLQLSPQYRERPDHIVCQFQFMAWLAELERRAWTSNDELSQERCQICRRAQERFFGEHVASWTPCLATLIVRHDPGGFYGAAAQWLAAWVHVERALLNVPAPEEHAEPSLPEPPELCSGCPLAP
jgi:TorA maturation chaperone TorD